VIVVAIACGAIACKNPPDTNQCKQLVQGAKLLSLGIASIADPTDEEREAYRVNLAELSATGAELGCVFAGTLLEKPLDP